MYLITRSDLSPGIQTAQCAHAMADLYRDFPADVGVWHSASNNVVCLMVPSELDLALVAQRVECSGFAVVRFFEPDLDDQMTAVGALVDAAGRRLFANYPLVGRGISYDPTIVR